MTVPVANRLRLNCEKSAEGSAWLERLPHAINEVTNRWRLTIGEPFGAACVDEPNGEGQCAWVAAVTRADGRQAVLKLGMPHMEADDEISGLRFWNGDPTVQLFDADDTLGAMLIERCEPGTSLRSLPEPKQDVVLAQLARRLWRVPGAEYAFRPLSVMTDCWTSETLANAGHWTDEGLVRVALETFRDLSQPSTNDVLVATDLHAGNVLRARRQPWLVIDPKPFVGDPAYDATQHLLNCHARMRADPRGTIQRFSDLLAVDAERVRRWFFARIASEPNDWANDRWSAVARAVAP